MKRKIAVLFAVLVALSGVGAAAAAVTWDTTTGDTSTTSDWSGTSNTETTYWGNASKSEFVEVTGLADPANATLQLVPKQSGVDYIAYENATPTVTNSTSGNAAWNVTHAELSTLPRDYQGGEYTAKVINDSGSVVNTTNVTFSTAAGASEDAYMVVTSNANTDAAALTNLVADTTEFQQTKGGFWSGLGSTVAFWESSSSNDSAPAVASFSGFTTVNGSNSDVYVTFENSSTANTYANAAADTKDGEWIRGMQVYINGNAYKVYKNSAPDDVNGTTVVYNANKDRLKASLGSEFDTANTVGIRSTAGKSYGFGTLRNAFGLMDALGSLWPF